MRIVIFTWWIWLHAISERRKIGFILILSLLDDPYPHCTEVPVPVFVSLPELIADNMLLELLDDTDSTDSIINSPSSVVAAVSSLSAKPKLFSQGQLNDLVPDLGLSRNRPKFFYLILVNMVYWIRKLKLHSTAIGANC